MGSAVMNTVTIIFNNKRNTPLIHKLRNSPRRLAVVWEAHPGINKLTTTYPDTEAEMDQFLKEWKEYNQQKMILPLFNVS